MHGMDLKRFFFPPRCLMWLMYLLVMYSLWEILVRQHNNNSFGQQDLLLVFDRWCINIPSEYCLTHFHLTSISITLAVMWLEIMWLSNEAAAETNDLNALYIAVAKSTYILSNESFPMNLCYFNPTSTWHWLSLPLSLKNSTLRLGRLISSRKSGGK